MTSYPKTKICLTCDKSFKKPYYESKKDWIHRHKYCSLKCRYKSQKGRKLPKSTRRKMSLARTGKNNPKWKGNKVGYHGIHTWVQRKLGKPDTCEECGKSGLKGVHIHWANKSGEYKRDLDDWIRLCVWCHLERDGTSIENKMQEQWGA